MRFTAPLIAVALAVTGLLAACGEETGTQVAEGPADAAIPPAPESILPPAAPPPLNPPAPGEPGGLPDDRTPLEEGPIDPDSAQGAGQVVQTYWALIEQGEYAQAYRLWADDGAASGMGEGEFAASFAKYSEIHAMIGAPGGIEGAAGSLYVEIEVQAYGRMADDGSEFNMIGPMTLRRVNGVPGATEEQLRWRIYSSGLTPRP